MVRSFNIEWHVTLHTFLVTDDDGPASLPFLPHQLDADLDAWEQHLADSFEPDHHDWFGGGRWSNEQARRWFVDEARRIERELAKAVPRSLGVIRVSPFPGLVPIEFFNDFTNWPLWTVFGHTGPEDFPMLSSELKADLSAWSAKHETGEVRTDEDRELAKRLQKELGPTFEVHT